MKLDKAWRALLEERIAEITIDLKTRQLRKIHHSPSHLTFECQRCGVFCCKLGGPRLSETDKSRLEQAGHITTDFLDVDQNSIRSRTDGSCIFLSFDIPTRLHKCSVYNLRPTLCRLYPFRFERSGRDSYSLRLIPCCNGLNTKDGESVDADFIAKTTSGILFELIDTGLV